MRLFDKLTGGGVDWLIEIQSQAGAFRPGDDLIGNVRYTPKGSMDVRSIVVSLVGKEEYVLLVRSSNTRSSSRGRSGTSDWDRRSFDQEVFRQDFQASGPTKIQAAGEIPFQFKLPADALPSFDSSVLKMRWQVRAGMDVGGRDPSTERDLYVIGGTDRLIAGDASLSASVTDQAGQAQIYVEPLPLMAGQQFRGYVEAAEQLDLGNVRVELKQHVATNGAGGGGGLSAAILGNTSLSVGDVTLNLGGRRDTSEDRVLWAGQLTPMGAGASGNRYQFAGALPLAPTGTVSLPHGSSSTIVDVVINRRLQPDRHISRPVAIVTG
jgi:hypothetical protein